MSYENIGADQIVTLRVEFMQKQLNSHLVQLLDLQKEQTKALVEKALSQMNIEREIARAVEAELPRILREAVRHASELAVNTFRDDLQVKASKAVERALKVRK